MTDRKPALTRMGVRPNATFFRDPDGRFVHACDLPPAILALTAPELAALAVFAEAMPELLEDPWHDRLDEAFERALAAAKEG